MTRKSKIAVRFRELLAAKPFHPFKVTTPTGAIGRIHDPDQAAISPLMNEVMFYDSQERFHRLQISQIQALQPVVAKRRKKKG